MPGRLIPQCIQWNGFRHRLLTRERYQSPLSSFQYQSGAHPSGAVNVRLQKAATTAFLLFAGKNYYLRLAHKAEKESKKTEEGRVYSVFNARGLVVNEETRYGGVY